MEYIEIIELDKTDKAIGLDLKVYPLVCIDNHNMPHILTGNSNVPTWCLKRNQVRKYDLPQKLEALLE